MDEFNGDVFSHMLKHMMHLSENLLVLSKEAIETQQWTDNFILHEMLIAPIEFDEKGRIIE